LAKTPTIREDSKMTTLWEMAATIRAEEAPVPGKLQAKQDGACAAGRDLEKPIDLRERRHMDFWCKSLGATRMQLYRAVAHVGPSPSAVRHFLRARFMPGKMRA
jgi:hypothetical protein